MRQYDISPTEAGLQVTAVIGRLADDTASIIASMSLAEGRHASRFFVAHLDRHYGHYRCRATAAGFAQCRRGRLQCRCGQMPPCLARPSGIMLCVVVHVSGRKALPTDDGRDMTLLTL